MQIGIICPIPHLEDFASQSNFHLILPHLYVHPKYVDFYRGCIKKGDFVLQDNSIFELSTSLNAKFLIQQGNMLGVSEIVASEVLNSSDASKKAVEDFITDSISVGNKIPILAVAQGSSLQEIVKHFFFLNSIKEIASLGLPFDLENLMDENEDKILNAHVRSITLRRVLNRWRLVDAILEISRKEGWFIKKTHLMGLSDGMELQKYSSDDRYKWIRSNDSSSAYVHGSAGILYTDRGLLCEKIPTKLDFESFLYNQTQKDAVNYNIKKLKEFSGSK